MKNQDKKHKKEWILAALLIAIALLAPTVAFAGVNVIYPSSEHTANVDTTPLITFAAGSDLSAAAGLGFAGSSTLATSDNGAAFSITLSGLSGGTVTIDDYVAISKDAALTSYKMEVASALSGTLTTPTVLKIRVWTGLTAPTADADTQVCGLLDLKAAAGTESTLGSGTAGSCTGSAKVQLVYQLPSDSSGSSTVSLRPSSLVAA